MTLEEMAQDIAGPRVEGFWEDEHETKYRSALKYLYQAQREAYERDAGIARQIGEKSTDPRDRIVANRIADEIEREPEGG